MVTAQEIGKKGGQVKSQAKAAAARKNASKPRGKWVTAIAYELSGVGAHKAFGCVIARGSPPRGAAASHAWICRQVVDLGVGLQDETTLNFLQLSVSSRRF